MNEEEKKFPSIITREGHSVGVSENYNRSNHKDFATSSELRQQRYSGMRLCSITDMRQIWIEGEVVASMNDSYAGHHPVEWEKLWERVFLIGNVKEAK